MGKRIFWVAAPVLVALAVPQSAMASVVFGHAAVDADVHAGTDQQPLVYNDVEQDIYSTPSALAVTFTDGADDYAPYQTVVASSTDTTTAKAKFVDATQGTVDFTSESTAMITPAGYAMNPDVYASVFGIGAFEYSFDVDVASILTVNYTTNDNDIGEVPQINDFSLPSNGTGSLTFYLPPSKFQNPLGDDYLSIASDQYGTNVTQMGAAGTTTGSIADEFSFTITPAPTIMPETGTWLMMLSGFAAIGITLRQRPRRVPRAA